MSKMKKFEGVLFGTLAAGFVVAAADSLIYGSAQEEYCQRVEAETTEFMTNAEMIETFDEILDNNSKVSIHWTYDAAADPDFPRIPVLGKTTCSAYMELEILGAE